MTLSQSLVRTFREFCERDERTSRTARRLHCAENSRKAGYAADSSTHFRLLQTLFTEDITMLRTSVSRRNLLVISLGLLILAVMTVALRPRAAQADEGVPFRGTLAVQFTGSQVCASTDCTTCVGNSGFYIEAQGIANTSLGPLFAEVLKCFNPAGGSFGTYAGTLTTTAPNRKDSLAWAYSGQNDNGGDFYGFGPFSGTLTITAGTGKFENAHGSATFTAASGPSIAAAAFLPPGQPSPFTMAGMAFYSVEGKFGIPSDVQ
jgi:hypothetical protein